MKSVWVQLLGTAFLFSCVSLAHAQSSDSVLYTRDTLKNANGEAIFHNICQGCHMPDAKGATGAGSYPALAANPKLISSQYMAAVILFGRHDMPSFATKPTIGEGFAGGTMLTDAQIADVINYVRTHFGNHYTDTITADDIKAMHPQDAQPKPKS
jgi:mono/diheme cytochrome c family protein